MQFSFSVDAPNDIICGREVAAQWQAKCASSSICDASDMKGRDSTPGALCMVTIETAASQSCSWYFMICKTFYSIFLSC